MPKNPKRPKTKAARLTHPSPNRTAAPPSKKADTPPEIEPNSATYTQSTSPTDVTQTELKIKKRVRMAFLDKWKNFWAFAGPAFTVFGFAQHYWPSISITAGVVMNNNEAMDTQFVVTNSGAIGLSHVKFSCDIMGRYAIIQEVSGEDLKAVEFLPPASPVSRACFTKALVKGEYLLKVIVNYEWPLFHKPGSAIAYFAVKPTVSGFVLVPEAPPSRPMMTLLKVVDEP